jgi:hypothetical protein
VRACCQPLNRHTTVLLLGACLALAEYSLRTVSASPSRCPWAVHSIAPSKMANCSQWHGALLAAASLRPAEPSTLKFQVHEAAPGRGRRCSKAAAPCRISRRRRSGPRPTRPTAKVLPLDIYFFSQAAIFRSLTNQRIRCTGLSAAPMRLAACCELGRLSQAPVSVDARRACESCGREHACTNADAGTVMSAVESSKHQAAAVAASRGDSYACWP